ncbi:hypothetical protein [Chitinophaga sp.]|uniref:hypothetical protein n=1 Tax=Chitinophaga sp. TaxID=1869181 RepID=UPI0031D5D982
MEKEKYPQKHFPGSKYPGIDDKDLVKVEVATHNLWTGKITPAKFTFPDGKVIIIHPLKR